MRVSRAARATAALHEIAGWSPALAAVIEAELTSLRREATECRQRQRDAEDEAVEMQTTVIGLRQQVRQTKGHNE